VLPIECGHIEAEVQGSGSDDQVFKRNGDSLCGLLALDAPGKLGNGERNRMNNQIVQDPSMKRRRRSRSAGVLAR
jgi:hypothetical protein